jgi:uncharacterized RDD family membrane protein YckC
MTAAVGSAKRARKRAKPRKDPRGRIQNYLPPEGVPLTFQIASLGARFGAQFLDVLITYLTIGVLLYLTAILIDLPWTAWLSLLALLTFLARIPYYVLSELVWNGRTLGKRILRIRVVSADGHRLTPHQIAARNLLKEVEFFTPLSFVFLAPTLPGLGVLLVLLWVIIILCVPIFSRTRQRIGDIVAGTYVIETPKVLLLGDLAVTQAAAAPQFAFQPHHLGVYGRYELQTLEAILRNTKNTAMDREAIAKISATIIRKIDFTDPVSSAQQLPFLYAFYRAQREFLENRKLFGDAREDKFHTTDPAPK